MSEEPFFPTQDELAAAKEKAVRLIAARPRSTAEIAQHLRQKGVAETQISQVVSQLQAVDLLDDGAFARYWVEQRETFKPRGRLALQQELRQKGIADEIIEQVLSEVDEFSAARRLAEKQAARWQQLPHQVYRQKMMQFLQRRGFHYEICNEITNEVWRSIESHT